MRTVWWLSFMYAFCVEHFRNSRLSVTISTCIQLAHTHTHTVHTHTNTFHCTHTHTHTHTHTSHTHTHTHTHSSSIGHSSNGNHINSCSEVFVLYNIWNVCKKCKTNNQANSFFVILPNFRIRSAMSNNLINTLVHGEVIKLAVFSSSKYFYRPQTKFGAR